MPKRGGSERWSIDRATPLRDEHGQVTQVISIRRDVTERKRAEDTARFLAAVNLELTRSLEYEETLRRVAELAVPTLADWCVAIGCLVISCHVAVQSCSGLKCLFYARPLSGTDAENLWISVMSPVGGIILSVIATCACGGTGYRNQEIAALILINFSLDYLR